VKWATSHRFLNLMKVGDAVDLHTGPGRDIFIRLESIQDVREDSTRICVFEVNGDPCHGQ
jgi:pyruvate carboxylase